MSYMKINRHDRDSAEYLWDHVLESVVLFLESDEARFPLSFDEISAIAGTAANAARKRIEEIFLD